MVGLSGDVDRVKRKNDAERRGRRLSFSCRDIRLAVFDAFLLGRGISKRISIYCRCLHDADHLAAGH